MSTGLLILIGSTLISVISAIFVIIQSNQRRKEAQQKLREFEEVSPQAKDEII